MADQERKLAQLILTNPEVMQLLGEFFDGRISIDIEKVKGQPVEVHVTVERHYLAKELIAQTA